jgi:tripartite-type tricarboxylate transporter receptor subunit TctC
MTRYLDTLAVLGVLMAASAGLGTSAQAQPAGSGYPDKNVRLIVPFAPGASTDVVARLIGQKLGERWGQIPLVENRAGAGGAIGGDAVVKSTPDGYTLLVTNQGPSIHTPLLRTKPPYDMSELGAIALIGYSPLILIGNNAFPAKNMQEFIAYAKANPGKVLVGSSGTNSNLHIALEMLKHATGIEVTHVPYKGTGPALNDVLAGTIHAAFTTTISAEGLIKDSQVRVLGVAGDKRMQVIPDVPTFEEQGVKGANISLWVGLQAPAKTPRGVIEKVNADVNTALQDALVKERFAQWGLEIGGGSADKFHALINEEAAAIKGLIDRKALTVTAQ